MQSSENPWQTPCLAGACRLQPMIKSLNDKAMGIFLFNAGFKQHASPSEQCFVVAKPIIEDHILL